MSAHILRLASAAAALGLVTMPVLAQTTTSQPASSMPTTSQPSSSAPAASQPTTSTPQAASNTTAPSASTGSNANATVSQTAALKAGMTVKDKNGSSIGQITSVDKDAKTGQQMATIKMGSDNFRLQADRLGVDNGAATVNLTQADIQAQLHPTPK
jgi:hypothetical protein